LEELITTLMVEIPITYLLYKTILISCPSASTSHSLAVISSLCG
jgi:hypothetical protein